MDEASRSEQRRRIESVFNAFGVPTTVQTTPRRPAFNTLMIRQQALRNQGYASTEEAAFLEQTEVARKRYEQDRDPFAPWQVYYAARSLKKSVPEWVMVHIDGVAEAIACRLRRDGKVDRAKLAEALSFTTRRGPTRGANIARDRMIADEIRARVKAGEAVKSAVVDVAKAKNVSLSTAERAWRAWKGRRDTIEGFWLLDHH